MKLKDPDVCLMYIEYYGTNPNNPPEKPYSVFFGRWVSKDFFVVKLAQCKNQTCCKKCCENFLDLIARGR